MVVAPSIDKFWKQEQITEGQFIDTADTFDILLFKCDAIGGKVIRSYTGSEFDHAALVIRCEETEEVHFIEAT